MVLAKSFLGLFCFCFINIAFALTEICPTVDEIKNQQFNYWLPLYIDGEELASQRDVQKFKDTVTRFVVARWLPASYIESGHCFYEGTDPIVSKITFAQDTWRPISDGKWIWKDPGKFAECYADNVQDCAFIE